MMNINPCDFWNMSIKEITMAINGFKEYNTGKKAQEPMNKDKLKKLQEMYPDF
ncbi:MAG: hypothetical protein Tp1123DCM1511741_46 [Prokaryotic dsDNA virus sp.]|nr:MAG: hypothetical protein Tp1123DCM1511741_46 [Prokaryotic dsDNA virus sp.]